jgi:hypothetical protein
MPLWSSIPGETPIDDVSGLKIKGIATRRQLSEFEARNINRAVSKYLGKRPSRRTAPFHYSWCLKLHKEMFGRVWQWAGQIRTQNLNVGVPFYQVPEQLYALLQDLDFWSQGSTTLVEQSARCTIARCRFTRLKTAMAAGRGSWPTSGCGGTVQAPFFGLNRLWAKPASFATSICWRFAQRMNSTTRP